MARVYIFFFYFEVSDFSGSEFWKIEFSVSLCVFVTSSWSSKTLAPIELPVNLRENKVYVFMYVCMHGLRVLFSELKRNVLKL